MNELQEKKAEMEKKFYAIDEKCYAIISILKGYKDQKEAMYYALGSQIAFIQSDIRELHKELAGN